MSQAPPHMDSGMAGDVLSAGEPCSRGGLVTPSIRLVFWVGYPVFSVTCNTSTLDMHAHKHALSKFTTDNFS